MGELDGVWDVERTGGALPPPIGVTKETRALAAGTRVGPVACLPFDVRGRALHYRGLLAGFVDELEAGGEVIRGRATLRGRQFGTFLMRRRAGS